MCSEFVAEKGPEICDHASHFFSEKWLKCSSYIGYVSYIWDLMSEFFLQLASFRKNHFGFISDTEDEDLWWTCG